MVIIKGIYISALISFSRVQIKHLNITVTSTFLEVHVVYVLTFIFWTTKLFHPVSLICFLSMLLRSNMLLDPLKVCCLKSFSVSGSSGW